MAQDPDGPIILPPKIEYKFTAACSSRRKQKVWLVVVHRWGGGSLDGVVNKFMNPKNEASSHTVYAGETGKDAGRCVQMVALNDKAWTCEYANAFSDNHEFGDAMWLGNDDLGWSVAARIVAWNLWKRGLPPMWVRKETLINGNPGFCRHYDLGAIGSNSDGHTDPTTDSRKWLKFVYMVKHEYERGDFRTNWLRVNSPPV